MLRNKYDYDIFIIGGGSAGVRAAEILASSGKRVGLCEPGELGGYEAREGYGQRAPFVQSAKLYATIKRSNEVGIRGGSVGYNYPTLREWGVRTVSSQQASARVKTTLERAGVRIYASSARFVGEHEVALGRQHISSAQFLITSGSTANIPAAISGLSDVDYLTPKTAIDLLKPPKSLFIIGGGKTGVEFAGLFSSFGSTIYIAEISPRLLPEEDIEAGDAVKAELEARGSEVLTSTRITSVAKDGVMYRITYLRGDVEHVTKAEKILLASGRLPNLDLGLENADVEYSAIGISVSPTLQTSAKHIFAAGSVTGNVQGPEGAILEAEQAAYNLLRRDRTAVDYASIPMIIYSQPNVARVGVNEAEALRKDITVTAATAPIHDTVFGSATRDTGFVKLIADRKGVLVGAVIVAESAEIINALSIAISAGVTLEKLARTPLGYGTIGEAITNAARQLAE